jgi:hypothetical protein
MFLDGMATSEDSSGESSSHTALRNVGETIFFEYKCYQVRISKEYALSRLVSYRGAHKGGRRSLG